MILNSIFISTMNYACIVIYKRNLLLKDWEFKFQIPKFKVTIAPEQWYSLS